MILVKWKGPKGERLEGMIVFTVYSDEQRALYAGVLDGKRKFHDVKLSDLTAIGDVRMRVARKHLAEAYQKKKS